MHNLKLSRIAPMLAAVACLASGAASANPNQRIVGGQPIVIDSTPSIVALIKTDILENTGSVSRAQFCGGTLIDSGWVLTAAHCLVFDDGVYSPDEIQVVANSHDLNNIVSDPIKAARIIVHSGYDERSHEADIALIQLSRPAIDSALVAPLNVTPVPMNETLVAAGWGARQFNSQQGSFDFADNLHAVRVLALPAAQCNTLPAYAGAISNTMMCAGIQAGGFDSCQGDSGGPLYRFGEDDSLVVAGVTSWGNGCALENRPGVYTDVAAFNDWIRDNTGVTIDAPVVAETQPSVPTGENSGDSVPAELSVTPNQEDGSTVVVLPSLASIQSSGGSAGGWLFLILLSCVGLRGRSVWLKRALSQDSL